jgi:hypothetical protein
MAAATIYNLIAARLTAPLQATHPITITFKDASKLSGLSVSHLRFLASKRGECKLQSVKVGRRRLVKRASLESLIRS